MVSILYKWLSLVAVWMISTSMVVHPIFVSVTEIEHNTADKILEISCKIFTDDFEKTLRQTYHIHVDLLNETEKNAMHKLVSDYVQKHLLLEVNGKPQVLKYKGFEQIEEAVYSYYQVDDVPVVKQLTITNDLLYEYHAQQISLFHVTANGKRQSTKLLNPEKQVIVKF